MSDRILIKPPLGHRYAIEFMDGTGEQEIQFVQRAPLHEPKPGILTQDLLRICIHRVEILDNEIKAWENREIIRHLRMALTLHEARALRRKVELGKLEFPELIPTGPDGHFKFAGD